MHLNLACYRGPTPFAVLSAHYNRDMGANGVSKIIHASALSSVKHCRGGYGENWRVGRRVDSSPEVGPWGQKEVYLASREEGEPEAVIKLLNCKAQFLMFFRIHFRSGFLIGVPCNLWNVCVPRAFSNGI
jgi:hypothetical protein